MQLIIQYASIMLPQYSNIRYFTQDESRFGLKTIEGQRITLKGVKPLGELQWLFYCLLAVWSS